jgi:predicted Zn-dependent protease
VSLARVVAVLFALLCCAWFALSARQAHNVAVASSIVNDNPPLTAAQVRRATDSLNAAASLNPDLEVDVLRGQLAIDQGHRAQARRILFGVIRREPKLLAAWQQYARASAGDPVAFYASQIGIRRLVRLFGPR